ncbi:MAG: hypothetical protein HGA98_01390 [Deltaproteobacteria bacterium]|nr:hypothetical protein [Deltaproteobacteria bacterium]
MSIKEVQARVMPNTSECRCCGHPRLQTVVGTVGDSRIWFEFCPSCRSVQERAAIPESFLEEMPAPVGCPFLH